MVSIYIRAIMNNRIPSLMLVTTISCLLASCSQTHSTLSNQAPEATKIQPSNSVKQHPNANLQWIDYADPQADANLAIQKQDLTLLAFAGRVTSFPGIEVESNILKQKCGYRLLANTSDVLREPNELAARKKLYKYASTYNQLVLVACEKNIIEINYTNLNPTWVSG